MEAFVCLFVLFLDSERFAAWPARVDSLGSRGQPISPAGMAQFIIQQPSRWKVVRVSVSELGGII